MVFKILFLGEVDDIFPDLLLVLGPVGYLPDLVEVLPHKLWLTV
jgi:hypothetical protein